MGKVRSANVTIEQEVYSGDLCVDFVPDCCRVADDSWWEGCGWEKGWDWTLSQDNPTLCSADDVVYIYVMDKDVASCNCTLEDTDLDGHLDTVVVTCNNTYPCYVDFIESELCNCGTIPWKIQSVDLVVDSTVVHTFTSVECVGVDLDGLDGDDMEIYLGWEVGEQIDPEDCATVGYFFHLLQEAPQNDILQFKLIVHVVQWNKYLP